MAQLGMPTLTSSEDRKSAYPGKKGRANLFLDVSAANQIAPATKCSRGAAPQARGAFLAAPGAAHRASAAALRQADTPQGRAGSARLVAASRRPRVPVRLFHRLRERFLYTCCKMTRAVLSPGLPSRASAHVSAGCFRDTVPRGDLCTARSRLVISLARSTWDTVMVLGNRNAAYETGEKCHRGSTACVRCWTRMKVAGFVTSLARQKTWALGKRECLFLCW